MSRGGNHFGSGTRPVTKSPSTPHGGFIVHRRLESSGRISTPPARSVYEHANRQDALDEADRLAVTYGAEFCVFSEIYTAYPPASVSQVEAAIDTPPVVSMHLQHTGSGNRKTISATDSTVDIVKSLHVGASAQLWKDGST
ncbi:hypothetical protein [Methylorubrum extorquens]